MLRLRGTAFFQPNEKNSCQIGINESKAGYSILITPETAEKEWKKMLDRTSLVITILGAINWLLVGLFQFDLVAYICGGQAAVVSRVIYTIVGIAGLWCISLLFRERNPARESE